MSQDSQDIASQCGLKKASDKKGYIMIKKKKHLSGKYHDNGQSSANTGSNLFEHCSSVHVNAGSSIRLPLSYCCWNHLSQYGLIVYSRHRDTVIVYRVTITA